MLTWFKQLYQTMLAKLYPEQKIEDDVEVDEVSNQLYDPYEHIIERLHHALAVNNHRAFDIERLEVLCDTVDTYIELLTIVEDSLLGKMDFPKDELSLRLVKVCNFYRSPDGRFGSILEKRSKLINRMLSVLDIHKRSLANATPPGWLSYALSRSITVIVNIDSLSTQLVTPRLGDQ